MDKNDPNTWPQTKDYLLVVLKDNTPYCSYYYNRIGKNFILFGHINYYKTTEPRFRPLNAMKTREVDYSNILYWSEIKFFNGK